MVDVGGAVPGHGDQGAAGAVVIIAGVAVGVALFDEVPEGIPVVVGGSPVLAGVYGLTPPGAVVVVGVGGDQGIVEDPVDPDQAVCGVVGVVEGFVVGESADLEGAGVVGIVDLFDVTIVVVAVGGGIVSREARVLDRVEPAVLVVAHPVVVVVRVAYLEDVAVLVVVVRYGGAVRKDDG